jgi:hypothetical protein
LPAAGQLPSTGPCVLVVVVVHVDRVHHVRLRAATEDAGRRSSGDTAHCQPEERHSNGVAQWRRLLPLARGDGRHRRNQETQFEEHRHRASSPLALSRRDLVLRAACARAYQEGRRRLRRVTRNWVAVATTTCASINDVAARGPTASRSVRVRSNPLLHDGAMTVRCSSRSGRLPPG